MNKNNSFHSRSDSTIINLIYILFGILGSLLGIFLLFLYLGQLYKNAKQKSRNPWLWVLLGIFCFAGCGFLGFYLIQYTSLNETIEIMILSLICAILGGIGISIISRVF